MRASSLVQLSGRNSRKPSMIGTSRDASVTDTSVWQFAFLPSADAYCGATPTDAVPFFGNAVSSMISHALSPPTSASACSHRVASSGPLRSEEHTAELQSLMRISYAVFCLKKKNTEQTVEIGSKRNQNLNYIKGKSDISSSVSHVIPRQQT